MAPPAKRQKLEGAPRRALTQKAQNGGQRARFAASPPNEEVPAEGLEEGMVEEGSDSETEFMITKPAATYNTLLQSLGVSRSSTDSTSKKNKRSIKTDRKETQTRPGDTDEEPGDTAEEPVEEDLDADEDLIDPYAPIDEEDAQDPFEIHFASPSEDELSVKIAALKDSRWRKDEALAKGLGKLVAMIPDAGSASSLYIHRGQMPLKEAKLKKRWVEPAVQIQRELEPLHDSLTPVMFSYADLLFGGRTVGNADGLRKLACLHALNHVFKTRDKVLKNTAKLARDQANGVEYRDQGFTRPKVLFLLETRQSCVRYMDTITQILAPEQQENKKRFQDTFVQNTDDFAEDRPDDFRELFSGNDDNDFRLGIKFTRKTLKYYSQFYASDMIIASPLGLRRAMKLDDAKKGDYDFLSSIELVVVDQADAMLMQNWEHVEQVFEHLNLQPKQPHGCDFSRVRAWYLDNQARHMRQTIVFSAYLTPELNGIFSTHMQNVAGKVRVVQEHAGSMLSSAHVQLRQTFYRFKSRSPASEPDERFKHFTTAVIPSITRHIPAEGDPGMGVLIFIPSYLDFVRVRNFFAGSAAAQNISFGVVSEYTETPEVRRARSHFFTGRHQVLLYTGRAHHFRRYKIRGVKKVLMYGLPENPRFYSEIIAGFLGASVEEGLVDGSEASARVMFSKWEGLALERIVGSGRAGRMLKDADGDTFDFR